MQIVEDVKLEALFHNVLNRDRRAHLDSSGVGELAKASASHSITSPECTGLSIVKMLRLVFAQPLYIATEQRLGRS
jgi:hypothetical protein